MKQVAVLLVGEWQDEPYAGELTRVVAESAGRARFDLVADANRAAQRLAAEVYDLVVLVEPRPGRYKTESIDALRRVAPLVRFWRLLGSWCEGEQRSARPPAACTRSYWHQWRAQWERELALASAGSCPAWGWPLTATADEGTLTLAERPIDRRHGSVVVCARTRATADALAEACRAGGYETWIESDSRSSAATSERPLVVLWDTSIEDASDAAIVERLRNAYAGAPLLAVVGFPRPADCQGTASAKVSAVISKPLVLADLLWNLQVLAG